MTASVRAGEHQGFWWLAREPSQRVPGVLVVNELGDPRLKLLGTLRVDPGRIFDVPEGRHRILGELETMSGVTLEGCIAIRSTGGLQQRRQEWHVAEAIFGAHFKHDEPWRFFGAWFYIPMLTRWMSHAITSFEHQFDETGATTRFGLSVSAESWPLWSVPGGQVTLSRTGGIKTTTETTSELESRVDIRIQSSATLDRDDMNALAVRPLQVLLALATGKFTSAMAGGAYLTADGSAQGVRSHDWVWHPHRVAVDPLRIDYGFQYGDIAGLGIANLQSWTERLPRIEPVVNLYLASLRQLGYSEITFLLITQALETLHRRESPATILDGEVWKKLAKQLRDVVNDILSGEEGSSDQKSQLHGKLDFLNEPGLRFRLKQTIFQLGDIGARVCGENLTKFVNDVVHTRNYYTHWSPNLESKALRDSGLLFATSRLVAVLEILLLRDLGFGVESKAVAAVVHRRVSWLPN